jgi:BlaI family penicillinase repressor
LPKPYKPTELEYAILQALWALGPATVRDVHTRLSVSREIGYTSVLKTLQIMTEKGLVLRDEAERAHVYRPTFTEEATQGGILTDLMQRVFGGSAQHLVLRALQVKPATPEERAEIRRLLDEMERNEKKEV